MKIKLFFFNFVIFISIQIYEVTMFCTKHKDHNVVTAALENLYQVLQCQAKPLLEILLSTTGIAPTITGELNSQQGNKYRISSNTLSGKKCRGKVTKILRG